MIRIVSAMTLVMLAACQTTTAPAPGQPGPVATPGASCAAPSGMGQSRAQIIAGANAMRSQTGMAPLSGNATLDAVAQAHACYLVRTGQFTHTGAGGSTPLRRVQAQGLSPRLTSENLAGAYRSAAQVAEAWRASPPHSQNILQPQLTHTGIGMAVAGDGTPIWVMVNAAL